METQQSPKTETPMTEKDRWLLAAAICSAIGTAITVFRRKEVVDQRDNGSKMRGTIVQTETLFKSEIK